MQEIFTDHYEEMLYTLHPRDSIIENVNKMIHCGDPSFGGAMYSFRTALLISTTSVSSEILNFVPVTA